YETGTPALLSPLAGHSAAAGDKNACGVGGWPRVGERSALGGLGWAASGGRAVRFGWVSEGGPACPSWPPSALVSSGGPGPAPPASRCRRRIDVPRRRTARRPSPTHPAAPRA